MGTYVDGYVYNVDELREAMEDKCAEHKDELEGKIPPARFLEIVLPEVGLVIGGYFFIVSNEHVEDFNAWFTFIDLMERYYGSWMEPYYLKAKQHHVDGYGPDEDSDGWREKGLVGLPNSEYEDEDY